MRSRTPSARRIWRLFSGGLTAEGKALVLESGGPAGARSRVIPRGRGALTVILALFFGWSVLEVRWGADLVHPGGGHLLAVMLAGIATPDLSAGVLAKGAEAVWITLTYALTGMTVAVAAGLPLGLVASGVLVSRPGARRATVAMARFVLACLRAVHELVWAWLFVAAIGLSPAVATLAIAIPYAGILGRIYADILNDVPAAPVRALATAGAGTGKQLLYGRLPLALPDMVSYTFYRLECALRASAIMSFVGLAGLGYRIQLALDDLRFHQVGTYLLALVVLIVATDSWSGVVRRRLVA